MRKLIAAVAVPLTVLLPAVVPAWDQAAAATRAPAGPARAAPARATDIAKIIAVLERGTTDPLLGAKAWEKLATLSDRQLHLMAALSERAAADGDGPARGLALFLITALLILS